MKRRKCTRCGIVRPNREFTFKYIATSAETKSYAKYMFCWECQKGIAAEREANPAARRRAEMSPYSVRDRILVTLGFDSYAAYLASEKWKKIRLRVLKLRNFTCEKCGDRAVEVHHNRYDKQILQGCSLKGLKALCRACHELIEFEGNRKVGAVEASHRFYDSRLPTNSRT